jgi:bifunctional DNA-binding transcriptional regulator/antitoxin component of YhaV-PrlF toxin-antitoxin module
MMNTLTIQIRDKGVITLPVELRRRYRLGTGDVYTLADLGQGAFLLTPGTSKVAARGDQIARLMAEQGVTLDEILETLDQEREAYYREQYVQT